MNRETKGWEKTLALAGPSSALGVAAVRGEVPAFLGYVAMVLIVLSLGLLFD
jgi:hypothetical protein